MVFQSNGLFPHMDVMRNLPLGPTKALGKNRRAAEAETAAFPEYIGLSDRAARPAQNPQGTGRTFRPERGSCQLPKQPMLT